MTLFLQDFSAIGLIACCYVAILNALEVYIDSIDGRKFDEHNVAVIIFALIAGSAFLSAMP